MKSTMKGNLKKLLALLMIASFSAVQIAFAQDDSSGADPSNASVAQPASPASSDTSNTDPTTNSTQPAAPDTSGSNTSADPADASASSTSAVDPQDQGGASLQDAAGGQDALSGDALESTADPQSASSSLDAGSQMPLIDASSSDATSSTADSQALPIADASSTPVTTIESTSTADVVAENIDQNIDADQDLSDDTSDGDGSATTTQDQSQVLAPAAIPIPIEALAPKQQYAFALSGTSIPTTAAVKNSDGTVTQQEISAVVTPVVNNADGSLTIAGECSDAYYVVLLFKNATDYADDPSSYLINKAYPCVGGTFTYSIKQLPYDLPDGDYYLMVGEEDASGSWTPITAQTEVTINRSATATNTASSTTTSTSTTI